MTAGAEAARARAHARARLASVFLFAGASLAPLLGCNVEPYCLYCQGEGTADGSQGDGSLDGNEPDGNEPDGQPGDAREEVPDGDPADAPDGCLAEELCNGVDDDCDDEVDEGIDTDTDPDNCGGCGNECNYDHARGQCADATCSMGDCAIAWYDLNDSDDDGCEYRCAGTSEDDSVCDRRDNDCDGTIDEDVAILTDTTNCGVCGRVCRFAHASSTCADGSCVLGECDEGYWSVDGNDTNGCEYPCTERDPAVESCNRRDDDCDGTVDEDDPGGGETCGTDEGACVAGTTHCVAGNLVCEDEVVPATETCDDADNDCDGDTDENNPGGGALCGSALGTCQQGRMACVGGELTCVGEVIREDESCDGLDNDCDGIIDNGNPGGGESCGPGVGACGAGVKTCSDGVIVCIGALDPEPEICDGVDNDCDGDVDEDFDTDNDRQNCGECGVVCAPEHAWGACVAGACEIVSCEDGFYDDNGTASDGCEYECTFNGGEVCNGVDDDCNQDTTEDELTPPDYCIPTGVCHGTTPTCDGTSGWVCHYDPASYEEEEVSCDGYDNDCDGQTDEPFPTLGDACTRGAGICQTDGFVVCTTDGAGVRCSAADPATPESEDCDDVDNDCDGAVDEVEADNPDTAWRDGIDLSAIDTVQIDDPSGGTLYIMKYEASRPDATPDEPGSASTLACSRAGVRPWTLVTYSEAEDACCALNADGECPDETETGWRLCSAEEWQAACEGPLGTCNWSTGTDCESGSQPGSATACNGDEYDCSLGEAGDQDCGFVTGSALFPECYTDWGAEGDVFDLSGNFQEWTSTETSDPGLHQVRGGSFLEIQAGRSCDNDFASGDLAYKTNNTGFRCCYRE